jgi:CRP-like cAMP-binding protein
MQRKVISLSKDTVLWEAGDAARGIAVVAKGKLGARTSQGLVGIVLPNMVLGESALLSREGTSERRTATIYALQDDTMVMEYPASEVRMAFDSGDDELMRQVTTNLVGQIARNLMMVVTAKRGQPFMDEPLVGLLRGILKDVQQKAPEQSWDGLILTCRFLADLRDMSDRLLGQLGPDGGDRAEMLVNASQMLAQLSEGQDIRPVLDVFLQAEQEKNDWWTRGS